MQGRPVPVLHTVELFSLPSFDADTAHGDHQLLKVHWLLL